MKNRIILYTFTGLILFITVSLYAKKDDNKNKMDNYFPDFKYDEEMKGETGDKSARTRGIQYGFWITPTFIYSDQGYKNEFITVSTARIWGKSYLWDNAYLYVRGKYTYTGTIMEEGDNASYNDHLYDLDLGYMAIASKKNTVQFFIGRKYFSVGSGLVLNGRGDGIELGFYSKYIQFRVLGCYTGFLRTQKNPFDINIRDISKGLKRIHTGGELSWDFLNQTVYAFAIGTFDFNKQHMFYKDKYEVQHYGIGIRGILFKNLSYFGEFVHERGKSYVYGNYYGWHKYNRVMSFAGQFSMRYYVKAKLYPVIIAQYAFGSGDVHRASYKLTNGNTNGGDFGFMYYGTYNGGYALQPTLGNMHIFRGGFAFSPFSWSRVLYIRSMSIIGKYSYYMKHRNAGAINTIEAPRNNRHIGQSADIGLRWLIFSDLSLFMNFGVFFPGNAYYKKAWEYLEFKLVDQTQQVYMLEKERYFIMFGFNISI